MITQLKPLAATAAAVLGLLLLALPAFAQPIQQSPNTISAAAIGVGPVQPQPQPQPNPGSPVQTGPVFSSPAAAIGVGPVESQPAPVQVGPAIGYPTPTPVAIGVAPVGPQPVPTPENVFPVQPVPGQYPAPQPMPVEPAQEYYPPPQGFPGTQALPHDLGPVVTVQPGGPQPVEQRPVRAVVRDLDKQRVIVGLQNLLNQQAALGQFPHNNTMLSEISALIVKHSKPRSSKVKVVNSGPGTLRVVHPTGATTDVPPNFNLEINVDASKVQLSAQLQNVLISLEHVAGVDVKFWDQDDRFHTTLSPGRLQAARKHHFTLTPGVWGHHLTR